MALKRKRSAADDSPLSVSSCTPEASSPTRMPLEGAMQMNKPHQDRPFGFLADTWNLMNAPRVKESDWGNRTRKRVRDNRPDERVIHENTINKLFSAQRRQPTSSCDAPSNAILPPPQSTTAVLQKSHQKSTLHSFWKQLPAPPVQAPESQTQQDPLASHSAWDSPRCDDCDVSLESEAEYCMDVDMVDINDDGHGRFACSECGRNVCGGCAIVSTARHCLQCATSRGNSGRWW